MPGELEKSCLPPPIYVINLKRVPERRLYMQRQLDALNLDYRIIDAIDKYDLLSKEYRVKIANQLGISDSWMEEAYKRYKISTGNADGLPRKLSHIKVFNMMKKDNIPMACILEDDAFLSPDFPKVLRDSQKISWDALQLSSDSRILYDSLVRIIATCPGSSPFPNHPLISLLRGFRELGLYALRLPLHTAWRIVATVTEIIYETTIGYFYFLVVGKSNRRYYGWRIRTFIYRKGAHYYIGMYYARKIGSLPSWNKKLWHKLGFKYRIVTLQGTTGSTTGYMITLKMANTFKQAITTEHIPLIDHLFHGAAKESMKSYVLSPPCVWSTLRYLLYSVKSR